MNSSDVAGRRARKEDYRPGPPSRVERETKSLAMLSRALISPDVLLRNFLIINDQFSLPFRGFARRRRYRIPFNDTLIYSTELHSVPQMKLSRLHFFQLKIIFHIYSQVIKK